jgi:hypothetical protein
MVIDLSDLGDGRMEVVGVDDGVGIGGFEGATVEGGVRMLLRRHGPDELQAYPLHDPTPERPKGPRPLHEIHDVEPCVDCEHKRWKAMRRVLVEDPVKLTFRN